MAKTFLHYNKYETAEAVFRRIGQLTPEILLEVGKRDVCGGLFIDTCLRLTAFSVAELWC